MFALTARRRLDGKPDSTERYSEEMMVTDPDALDVQPSTQQPKGWYSRGYIPHFDHPGLIQGIAFRLADSLPAHVLASLAEEVKSADDPAKRARIEAYLNAGYGACHLRDPRIAHMVENALLHFDRALLDDRLGSHAQPRARVDRDV
jgi:hypothetical protein